MDKDQRTGVESEIAVRLANLLEIVADDAERGDDAVLVDVGGLTAARSDVLLEVVATARGRPGSALGIRYR